VGGLMGTGKSTWLNVMANILDKSLEEDVFQASK